MSGRSLVALLYLITFGALVGFTAYIWLLRVANPVLVSTYAYVNPFVAVLFLLYSIGRYAEGRRFGIATVVTTVVAAEIRTALPAALEGLTKNVDRVHVHIDLDVLDASVARANTYAVGGGLTGEDLEFAVSSIGRALPIAGITLSAYDPAGDTSDHAAKAAIRLISAAARVAERA